MMMLGIVIHGSMWYMSEQLEAIPLPTDASTSYVFVIAMLFVHSFRMPLFFILAGFFTSLLVEKRGITGAYVNRAKRVLAPLLVGTFTILPLSLLCIAAFATSVRFNTHQFLPTQDQFNQWGEEMVATGARNEPILLHLWFLYYLLYFYLTIPVCLAIVRPARRRSTTGLPSRRCSSCSACSPRRRCGPTRAESSSADSSILRRASRH
jgi:peptidoglycan/LPS O-acetylase OafA/YrhL